jgi:23S rRNA (uracil1939-C5)-methyltransferase
MGRTKRPHLEKVEITAIGSEGKALGRVGDIVVFVPLLVPGDIVDIQVTRKRKKFMEGFVTHFHKYSDLRQTPECSHFGVCGGCKWQHLPYEKQLEFKQQQVVDNFRRIGKFEHPQIMPIIPSREIYYYRNKLEFTFSNKRWLTKEEISSESQFSVRDALGFHIPGMFDKVLDIEQCYLQGSISNEIRNETREFAQANGFTFFDLKEQSGFLRNLIIRTSTTGEILVILSFYHEESEKRELLLSHLAKKFKEITSLMYTINSKPNDSIGDQEILLYSGQDHMIEEMENLKFRVGPKSFYQTNSHQAYELYKVAREMAGLKGDEIVYDLYTGTGTIANFIASNAGMVVGIESVEEAVEDAKVNSELNGIDNTRFFTGDMKDILTQEFFFDHGRPEIIITDPPRAGMHEKVIGAILAAYPEKIVYVSCNPATQARDISLMIEKYRVEAVQPVDMFPQTHHVECVVLLSKI